MIPSESVEACPNPWNSVACSSMPIPVKFLKSAVLAADYPDQKRPEVAIAGRSNSGKSSFINVLTTSKIAKVSQEPGKTRLLNFFDVGDFYRLVDTPGYGFASRSGSEVMQWQEMLENYLSTRENLVGLLLLMDIKRDWTEDEEALLSYMNSSGRPTMILLSKDDRLKPGEIKRRCEAIKKQARVQNVWSISAQNETGIEEVEEYFFRQWVKAPKGQK